MTTTQANTANNAPKFNVVFPEEVPASPLLAARLGKTLPENPAPVVIWHRAGVVFETKSGNLAIFIGEKGDAAQRKFLALPSSINNASDASRLPVANVFERNADGDIDFREQAGVLFLNRDEKSYTFVLNDGEEKVRYQLMPPKGPSAPKAAQQTKQEPKRSTIRRPAATPTPAAA